MKAGEMATVIVSGALANKYRNGGGTWERMSWVVGLRRLGFDVYFVEQIAPEACVDSAARTTTFEESVNLEWFRRVTEFFGVAAQSALVYGEGQRCAGLTWERLLEVAEDASLLVNLSGHLSLPALLERIARKAYVDVDPGFTQFWHDDPGTEFELKGHDYYYTIGENIGTPSCLIPTDGISWRSVRQPVVLEHWPVAGMTEYRRFTTVAGWRGPFGPIYFDGRMLGLKVHEFRKFIELPRRCAHDRFEIALDIHPADEKDRRALVENGWRLVDPRAVACGPDDFRSYIQGSFAEFSVAQGVYVETNSGWFSDRTVRYLASGKPALVQETGFSGLYPVGEGLLSFRTLEEAAEGAERITREYGKHCRAARAIAEEYFDSDKVLGKFTEGLGVAP
jgi:hypothetical protein